MIHIKYILVLTVLCLFCSGAAAAELHTDSSPVIEETTVTDDTVQTASRLSFNEVWGYLMMWDASEINQNMPFTDLACFSVAINEVGALYGTTRVAAKIVPLKNKTKRRMHLVVSIVPNRTLIHFILSKDFGLRDKLVADIVIASKNFDGIQIDFENIRHEDAAAYHDFLREVKKNMPQNKIFSVAVPARNTFVVSDPFDYKILSGIADRIIIMAYDEHWSTSAPGPIASAAWCRGIQRYAQGIIPPEKLVMGLPLYGRAWQEQKIPSALKYSQSASIKKQKNTPPPDPEYPSITYKETVTINVYYEDTQSLMKKLAMYHAKGTRGVAFWRIGQGPADLWKNINAENKVQTP